MRIGRVALGAHEAPAVALVAPGVGQLATDLALDVAGVLQSWTGRWARVVARAIVTVLRTRGPALVGLLVRRPWSGSPRLAAGSPASGTHGDDVIAFTPLPEDLPAGSSAARARRLELVLPADPTAPGRARALLNDAVEDWDLDDELHQDAAMVITELVANAVDHARTPSTLTLEFDARGLRIAVRDARPGRSLRALPVDPTAPRGRGLQMIEALAVAWGVAQDVDGKTVWAVLPRH